MRAGVLALLIVVPWLVFLSVLAAFALAFHHYHRLVWGLVFCSILTSAAYGALGVLQRRTTYLYMGALCGTASLVAALSGLYSYNQLLVQYWESYTGHSFVNVLPSDNSAGYADAGKILFAEEARVDSLKAVGYMSGGDMYCVAPILDDSIITKIEFWAVGMNCCTARGVFACDDAWSPKAHGGMVIHDVESLLAKDRHDFYVKAVRMAEASYDISSVKEPLFVRWVIDPQTVETEFWESGLVLLTVLAVSHLIFSIICGCALSETQKS